MLALNLKYDYTWHNMSDYNEKQDLEHQNSRRCKRCKSFHIRSWDITNTAITNLGNQIKINRQKQSNEESYNEVVEKFHIEIR